MVSPQRPSGSPPAPIRRPADHILRVAASLALLVALAEAAAFLGDAPRGKSRPQAAPEAASPAPAPAGGAPAAQAFLRSHDWLGTAEASLTGGDVAAARQGLAEAAVPEGERSYRAVRALLLAARIDLADGRPANAVRHARRAEGIAVDDDVLDARLALAGALESAGEGLAAFDVRLQLAEGSGILLRGELSSQVRAELARQAGGLRPTTPEARERLLRYVRVLYRFGRWAEGVAVISRAELPSWQEQEAQASDALARGLGRTGESERRRSVLEGALARGVSRGWPASRLAPLRLQLAQEYRARGAGSAAEALLQAVLRESPAGEPAGEALAALVEPAIDAWDVEQARHVVETLGHNAAGTAGWRSAIWSIFVAACGPGPRSAGNPAVARWALDTLASGGRRDAPYLYWAARAEAGGEGDSGPGGAAPPQPVAALVRELHDAYPLTYYSALARERWPVLSPPKDPGQDGRAADRAPSPDLHPAIRELKERGRLREATWELRYFLREHPSPAGTATLARWETELGEYAAAMGRLNGLAAAGSPPPWVLEGLFPIPATFRPTVESWALARQVDPYLVYAVMRQESAFQANALSPAGAYGLMQILPSTAGWIAGREGLTVEAPARLFDADLNVRLGVAYLSYLLQRYRDVRLAVAAYHAGPATLDGWLASRATPDLDLFVERIPLASTRQYVQAVYRSYRFYDLLYRPTGAP